MHSKLVLMGGFAAAVFLTAACGSGAGSYGAAMGSFAVEKFGIQGLAGVTLADVRARVRVFKDLVHFEVDEERGA